MAGPQSINKKTAIAVILMVVMVVLLAAKASEIVSFYRYKFVKRTVADARKEYGEKVNNTLKPLFAAARLAYPPQKVSLLAFKDKKRLELYGSDGHDWQFIKAYSILAASGKSGPKLLEGDGQVPEGLYKISGLNPNSAFHLSMKLNYPNGFDLSHAKAEGRTNLGGDIFIHGGCSSVGCIALGDPAIEELFLLIDKVGTENVSVIVAPTDFRKNGANVQEHSPVWLPQLYNDIRQALFQNYTPRS